MRPNVHYHLGLIYKDRGDIDQAANAFERALEVNPADRDAQYWLGWLERQRQARAEARNLQLRIDPEAALGDAGAESAGRSPPATWRTGVSTEVTNVSSGLRGDAVWNGPPVKVRENPERLAWVVLIACFGVFMVLLITVPLTLRYFVQHATSPQSATLDPTQGTVLLYQPGATEPIAITELRKDVVEGSTIVAGDGPTQATLRLISEGAADEALGSVQIYTGSRLQIPHMRSPMFELSNEPYQVQLKLEQGQARVFTNSGRQRPLSVEIVTPHGSIMLDTGSFQIAVTENQTDITVSSGSATLVKADQPDAGGDGGPACLDDCRYHRQRTCARRPEPPAQRQLQRIYA